MFLEQQNNLPISAPQVADLAAMLEVYRTCTGLESMSTADLVKFLSTPSNSRMRFLSVLPSSLRIVRNSYATQTY